MYVIIVVLLKFNEIINTTLSITEVILSRKKTLLYILPVRFFFLNLVSSGSEAKAAVYHQSPHKNLFFIAYFPQTSPNS